MNSESIMKSDVLDILFEKRNKAYGAYTLRKFYKNRLIKSIGIMVFTVIVFSAFTFLPERPKEIVYDIADTGLVDIIPGQKKEAVKAKPIPLATKTISSMLKFTSKMVIVPNIDSVEKLHDLKEEAIGGNTNILVNGGGPQIAGNTGTGNEGIFEPVPVEEIPMDVTTPTENPEIMPQFPGGLAALRKFLERHLSNPRDLAEGELISVKVRFVVGFDGKLQRFELVEDGGTEFNNEVMRVLKKMPAWTPGKSKGQNVSVYYIIPVKFIPEG